MEREACAVITAAQNSYLGMVLAALDVRREDSKMKETTKALLSLTWRSEITYPNAWEEASHNKCKSDLLTGPKLFR